MASQRSIAIFDLGGVLFDWDPRYLYRKLFNGDESAVEHFLTNICTPDWNEQQDAGRTFAEGCNALKTIHPRHASMIDAWFERYDEMLAGEIPGSVAVLSELRSNGTPLYALSNWSTETFPFAQRRFECLKWFRAVMLSGDVRLVKPDPRIFDLFLKTHAVDPARAVYIDDRRDNVDSAASFGLHAIQFKNAPALRAELAELGLVP
jgi:2-haloacid dehalogenase